MQAPLNRTPGFAQGLALVLPVTMAVMAVSVLTSVVPLMEQHFSGMPHADYFVPVLMTVPALCILPFAPAAGWLADRYGRRKILLWALVLYAVVGVLPAFLDGFGAILTARAGVGICESVVLTVTTTMIGDYFKGHHRERWLASQAAVANLAALVIIPVGGLLGSSMGWRGPFYLYATSVLMALGILLFTWEPEHRDDPSDPGAAADSVYRSIPWPRILALCLLTVVVSVCFYSIVLQNGNALATLGIIDPAAIGRYTMFAAVGVPIGAFLYSRVGPRWHIGTVVLAESLLVAIGFWMMGHAQSASGYTAWAFVAQVGSGMSLPTFLVWTTRGLAFEHRGLGTGLWQGAFAIGQFLAALLMPFLAGMSGSMQGAFQWLAIAGIVLAAGGLAGRLFRPGGAAAGPAQ
jgi:MFS family permease